MAPKSLKRKLKRSRRSLNEIRNRTSILKRLNINKNLCNMRENSNSKSSHINENYMILPNRMIRSDTITRSVFHESQRNCTNMSIAYNKYCCNKSIVDSDSTSDRNVSKHVELFSPLQESLIQDVDSDTWDIFQNSERSTPSYLSSEQDSAENIYDCFLNSLSKYILETAPGLLQSDIINKKKLYLQKFFSEINRLDTLKLRNIKNVKNNTLRSAYSETDVSSMENSKKYQEFPPQMQVANTGDISSPAESVTLHTMDDSSISDGSNLCDSPEYSYYPHRLNN